MRFTTRARCTPYIYYNTFVEAHAVYTSNKSRAFSRGRPVAGGAREV